MGRKLAVGITAAALACSGLALSAPAAGASTFDVTSGADDGSPGTFRWAVEQAGLNAGDDVVEIDPSVTAISLTDCTAGRVQITPSNLLTINGNGATVTQTCATHGVIGGIGDTAINDLTITGGDADGDGGGILLNGGLTLDGVTITGNAATGSGGGIFGVAPVITDSSISGNTAADNGGGIFAVSTDPVSLTGTTVEGNVAGATGGGLAAGGPVTVTGSAFLTNEATIAAGLIGVGDVTITGSEVRGNVASESGGGAVSQANLDVIDSTIEDNVAIVFGGGAAGTLSVLVSDSTVAGNRAAGGAGVASQSVLVVGSSITGNEATEFGGGIYSLESAVVTNSTVTGNAAAGGAGITALGSLDLVYATLVGNTGAENLLATGPVTSIGTVIAAGAATDCRFDAPGAMVSGGYNFSGDASCGFTASTDTASGGDPLLSNLDLHDGPTANHVPLSGSPLLNRIPAGDDACAGTDQRGFARPANGACDIGSVEVRQVAAASTSVSTPFETAVATDLVPLVTDPDGVLSNYTVSGTPVGDVSPAEGGVVTYTPARGFSGADAYSYVVCSTGDVICTSVQTVSITVGPGRVAAATPVAAAPTFTG